VSRNNWDEEIKWSRCGKAGRWTFRGAKKYNWWWVKADLELLKNWLVAGQELVYTNYASATVASLISANT